MARLSLVTLLVDDYDRAVAFYAAMPGFRVREDTPLEERDARGRQKRWLVIGPDEGTALLIARSDTPEQDARTGDPSGGRVSHFLETDDFERDAATLREAGATFEEQPRREPYGTVAVWRDPFGYRWDLIERVRS